MGKQLHWVVGVMVVVTAAFWPGIAGGERPAWVTNEVRPCVPDAPVVAPGVSLGDSLEFAISRYFSFSAHGKLADISFPSWWALGGSLALLPLLAGVLVSIQRPEQWGRPQQVTRTKRLLFIAAWGTLGLFLGGVLFGGFDFGVISVCLGAALAWRAHHLWVSASCYYARVVKAVTLLFLILVPGVLPSILTGTFINWDYSAMLGKPLPPETRKLLERLHEHFPDLYWLARQQRVSIRLAKGSAGPLAEVWHPIIGPTTIALDGRMAEASPDQAASYLAHELKHVNDDGRRWPGVVGALLLDLRGRDLLACEREVAEMQADVENSLKGSARSQQPTAEDILAFYPEARRGPLDLILRRAGAATLLICAYLFWPRLRVSLTRRKLACRGEREICAEKFAQGREEGRKIAVGGPVPSPDRSSRPDLVQRGN